MLFYNCEVIYPKINPVLDRQRGNVKSNVFDLILSELAPIKRTYWWYEQLFEVMHSVFHAMREWQREKYLFASKTVRRK